MKPLVILTYNDTLRPEDAERIKRQVQEHRPDIDWLVVDRCSGAVVVGVDRPDRQVIINTPPPLSL